MIPRRGSRHTVDTGQWCRVVMDQATRELVARLAHTRRDALEISGVRWQHAGFKSYECKRQKDLDICGDLDLHPRYDIVIAEQVLEHVADPDKAVSNFRRLLRPGGFALVTTPFLIRYHPDPLDLWRWTEQGLRLLFSRHGFEPVTTGSWGNRECLIANLAEWTRYRPGIHSLHNEPDFPLVVWLLARLRQDQGG